MDKKSVVLH